MFHHSASRLRRIMAQVSAVALIFVAAARFDAAHAQGVVVRDLGKVYSSRDTTVTLSPPTSTVASIRWVNPYAEANFTVTVEVTAGSPVDQFQVYGTGTVTQVSRGPARFHVLSGIARKGAQNVLVGPQPVSLGQTTIKATIYVNQQGGTPMPVPANMCNPIPHVGVFGGQSTVPQVVHRSNISFGPGEMECYMFTIHSSYTTGRQTTLMIGNLPPTGTKTITIVNPNGPYPLGPVSTTAASFGRTMTLMPGHYYLVVVVGGDSVSRTNYAWSLQ